MVLRPFFFDGRRFGHGSTSREDGSRWGRQHDPPRGGLRRAPNPVGYMIPCRGSEVRGAAGQGCTRPVGRRGRPAAAVNSAQQNTHFPVQAPGGLESRRSAVPIGRRETGNARARDTTSRSIERAGRQGARVSRGLGGPSVPGCRLLHGSSVLRGWARRARGAREARCRTAISIGGPSFGGEAN